MIRRCVIAFVLIAIVRAIAGAPSFLSRSSSAREPDGDKARTKHETWSKAHASKSSSAREPDGDKARTKRETRSKAHASKSSAGQPPHAAMARTRHGAHSKGQVSQSSSSAEPHGAMERTEGVARSRDLPAPPAETPNIMPLSPMEQLGKNIFFDQTLSNPTGLSCATCHVPSAGFTGGSSAVNSAMGPMPGVVAGRFGRRKPQAVPYATFSPVGPYYSDDLQVWLGGTFWDGRTPDTAGQARMPFLDANEMANTPIGPYPPHSGGYSPLVAEKLQNRPYTPLFEQAFGFDVVASSAADIYSMATTAIAAFEASAEVDQFSSKYDASSYGTPPMNKYKLTRSEENGMALFFGKAQCSACHSSATLTPVLEVTGGKDAFTMYCYANIGVPRNPNNPFYHNTNCSSNPDGCNALGPNFIDFGLGMSPNPSPNGMRFMNSTPGDIGEFRGLFKAPSVRNVDKRPKPDFVKAYMHNGVFKSLEQVVHFYNKRNIAVNHLGHEVAFDLRVGPPAGYTRLLAPPEVLDNVQNVTGASPADAGSDISNNGQVGNLGLTPSEQTDLINFLKTLTDGFTGPNPVDLE